MVAGAAVPWPRLSLSRPGAPASRSQTDPDSFRPRSGCGSSTSRTRPSSKWARTALKSAASGVSYRARGATSAGCSCWETSANKTKTNKKSSLVTWSHSIHPSPKGGSWVARSQCHGCSPTPAAVRAPVGLGARGCHQQGKNPWQLIWQAVVCHAAFILLYCVW